MAESKVIDKSQIENMTEIYHGEHVCKQKSLELLEEIGLPKGILPVEIVEFERNRSTGFVCMKLKTKKEHKFKCIKRVVSYDTHITFYAEKGRIKKLTGIKAKELFIWVGVLEMFIDDPSSGKIFFAVTGGIKVNFPVKGLELEEDPKVHNKK